jgi:hypothetical protein
MRQDLLVHLDVVVVLEGEELKPWSRTRQMAGGWMQAWARGWISRRIGRLVNRAPDATEGQDHGSIAAHAFPEITSRQGLPR